MANKVTTTKGAMVIKDKEEKQKVAVETVKTAEEATQVTQSIPEVPMVIVEDRRKLVEVTPKFTGKRFIAGDWYEFEKDKEIKVPLNVKNYMRYSGVIYL